MRTIQIILFSLLSLFLNGQDMIQGIVLDPDNIPLTGANVFIKGSYDGTVSDTLGKFKLMAQRTDSSVLVISFLGYETSYIDISGHTATKNLSIILKNKAGELNEVVITAGSFDASEKKRAVVLDAIEIATTASSDGDLFGALAMFPGVQKQGESGKIIVRGGDAGESKTFMDGLLVSSPYTSNMPNLPARGRFVPFMFNGVMFSTGGYSAEYGQAMSSVLELQTPGTFDESVTSIGLMNVGASLGHTHKGARSAISAEGSYNNLTPYFLMAKHELDWKKIPESFNGRLNYRQNIGKNGLLKADATYSNSSSQLNYTNIAPGIDKVGLYNSNLFVKAGYNTELNDKLLLKIGYAFNQNKDHKTIGQNELNEDLSSQHFKAMLIHQINSKISLKTGIENIFMKYGFKYTDVSENSSYPFKVNEMLWGVFAEGDFKVTRKFAVRTGLRSEYSNYTHKKNLAPRISLAYKTGKNSQVSLASGSFYQQPHLTYLKYTKALKFEQANHYILNYQIQKDHRIFRTELFQKDYSHLITYTPGVYSEYDSLGNDGFGFARGFDIFWKDSKSIRYLKYWISYSYISSQRKFREYPFATTPEFVAHHNLSFVSKYWINKLNTQASISYDFISGRPYNNPNQEKYLASRTKNFHNLSASISYITNIWGYFTVVHASVTNIPGLDNIYSYRYTSTPNEDGVYTSSPIKSMTQRTIIIGIFISLK